MITFIIGFALGGALGILAMCVVAINTDKDNRP